MAKDITKVRYYQPEQYYDDGTNIDYVLPPELNSFEVFRTREECEIWLERHGYDPRDFIINEYDGDDIEEPTFIET